jgi:carbohydrate kinase (thermoresistant glucokinase family)
VIVIMGGVAGSGKTTIGAMLAGRLNWRFADADDFHPAANVAKMHAGVPLTDEDRWPWLRAIAAWMDARISAGESAVVACSALKRAHRDLLLGGRPSAWVVFLSVDRARLADRLAIRGGHFFPRDLLDSQLDAVELPGPDERAVVIEEREGPAATVEQIVSWLRRLDPDEAEA